MDLEVVEPAGSCSPVVMTRVNREAFWRAAALSTSGAGIQVKVCVVKSFFFLEVFLL